MGKKLYVGNLPYTCTSEELTDLFSSAGKVEDAIVINDRETGRSKGFGFVTMGSIEDADSAMKMLNGRDLAGRDLTVNEAREKPKSDSRPQGGGSRDYGNNRSFGSRR